MHKPWHAAKKKLLYIGVLRVFCFLKYWYEVAYTILLRVGVYISIESKVLSGSQVHASKVGGIQIANKYKILYAQ